MPRYKKYQGPRVYLGFSWPALFFIEDTFYGTLKVSAIIHNRYISMMRHYLKEVNMYGTQTGIYPGISMAKKCCQRPGTKLSANPAPKSNYISGTLDTRPMLGWHL